MKNASVHKPIFLEELSAPFIQKQGSVYVDATLGGGGHLSHLLKHCPKTIFYAFDCDKSAIERASHRFRKEITQKRLFLIHDNFRNIAAALKKYAVSCIDGIYADLGFSSDQLEDASRGISFAREGPLDMRLDQGQGKRAANLLEELSFEELRSLFFRYGEERFSSRIARAIVAQREKKPFSSTAELAQCIASQVPNSARSKIHPATRTFQALRIAVNEELDALESLLEEMPSLLCPGGILACISFHSLEDRKVKRAFQDWSKSCLCPPSLPVCQCTKKSLGKPLWSGAKKASLEEQKNNPRSRSAKLRAYGRFFS